MEKWTVLGSSVDWITATCRPGPQAATFLSLGARILQTEQENGNPSRPAKFQGYLGASSLHAFAGIRDDGALIRLGGGVARRGWRHVARSGTHVTRLDMAVTVQSTPALRDVALAHWNAIRESKTRGEKLSDYSLIQTVWTGSALYCGKRESARYGRIYDKYAESRGYYPPGSWRYEIEYKGDRIKDVVTWLLTRRDTPGQILGHTWHAFDDMHIVAPWDPYEPEWTAQVERTPSTAESKYQWLKDTVAGTVSTLSGYYTASELGQALGLINPDEWSTDRTAGREMVARIRALTSPIKDRGKEGELPGV